MVWIRRSQMRLDVFHRSQVPSVWRLHHSLPRLTGREAFAVELGFGRDLRPRWRPLTTLFHPQQDLYG